MDGNWYVFFVKSGQEIKAADEIKVCFPDEVETRILSVETFFRKGGSVRKEKNIVFPGYVFVLSGLENDPFVIRSKALTLRSDLIYKILFYGDTRQAALDARDAGLLEKLWMGQNCLETSIGIMDGDKVKIIGGPFVGQESMIRKVNRHKRQAVVEIDFMGEARQITIGLDISRKDENG